MSDRFVEWIREGLKRPGKTQIGIANALGIAHPQITQMLKGKRRIKVDEIPKIAAYLEIAAPSMGEPIEPQRVPFEESNANEYRDNWKPSMPGGLPQIDARAGTGHGTVGSVVTLNRGGITTGHLVTQEWVVPPTVLGTPPKKVFALPVDGTSMEPGLNTDDIVFVEPTERIKSGEIYVIDDGDGPMVKRLRIDRNELPPRLWVTSDNPAVPDFWRPLGAVRIIGQVIGKFVRMRAR
ncbi:LexA family transcriptional regulator [Pleomorphomonas sp. JP5]|uniref:LexA family transcriptional regulator n=1 Tax=Pleomorphomonas sp. JP5 TaxID=2942998 RepID=UPI002042DA1E|nr:LexA family transcriptional regulator [Pleomorphomonas sp. JP5]MCM5558509.1 LexA family transcriptional regulator [Pleomorphomonas sp. JP5]